MVRSRQSPAFTPLLPVERLTKHNYDFVLIAPQFVLMITVPDKNRAPITYTKTLMANALTPSNSLMTHSQQLANEFKAMRLYLKNNKNSKISDH